MIENFHEPPRAGLLWAARIAALVAMLVSGYLLYASLVTHDQVAGCGTGTVFDCDEVLTSRWSHWLQLPVSLPGIVIYGLALLCLAAVGPDTSPVNQGYAWRVLLVLAVLEIGAALWFIGLQAFAVEHFCKFCLTVHACGLFLGCFVLWSFPRSVANARAYRPDMVGLPPTARVGCSLVGLGALAVLAGGQLLASPESRGAEEFDPSAQVALNNEPNRETEPEPSTTVKDHRPDYTPKIGEDELEDEWKNPPKEDTSATLPLPKSQQGAEPEETIDDDTGPGDPAAFEEPSESTTVERPVIESTPKAEAKPKSNGKPTRVASDDAEPEDDPFAGLDSNDEPRPVAIIKGEPRVGVDPGSITSQPITVGQHRQLWVIENIASVDTYSDPIIGSPDAESVIIKMFDYTCKHCRAEHKLIEQARKRYGGNLAIVLLPMPMNSRCNRFKQGDSIDHKYACEYTQLALAVWRANPKKFEQFHRYLMESYESTSPQLAKQRAEQLVGADLFKSTMADPAVEKDMKANVEIYGHLGGGPIPKLINGMAKSAGLQGEPKNLQALIDFLERTVGVRPEQQ